jgi:Fur family transcriptional regulator, ferric uptake regulator
MPTLEELKALSRAAGLRVTRQRLSVLAGMVAARRPLSHPELSALIGPRDVDRTTVFRNLRALVRAGLVRRVDLGDRTWRFELTTRKTPSALFKCTSCRVEIVLANTRLVLGAPRADIPRAVLRGRASLELMGRCNACARGG